ncbi:MAG: cob(I)yrinic acid a,c-diamide adenosyltransferase [Williamsia sp.]|nr:cob(I)yrinic acid a,c-diamide adenosyltransferase [Williamsia sp.]
MAIKIYTRTGDKGLTGLIGGTKVPKSDHRIEAYGTIDELNSYLGLVSDLLPEGMDKREIRAIQDRLFAIGSSLACDPEKEPAMKIPDLKAEDTRELEERIDRMEQTLPPMKHFILPGGHVAVSTTHVARCVCRRAERLCVGLQESGSFVEPEVLRYLNRLSDYLFVLARSIAHSLQIAEVIWTARG